MTTIATLREIMAVVRERQAAKADLDERAPMPAGVITFPSASDRWGTITHGPWGPLEVPVRVGVEDEG